MNGGEHQRARLLEWAFVLGFFGLAMEGLLKRWFEQLLTTGGAFWLGPIPYLFFPSELVSILILVPLLAIALLAQGARLTRQAWFGLIVFLSIYGLLHLWLDSKYSTVNVPGTTMFSEYKGMVARMAFVPGAYIAAFRISPVHMQALIIRAGLAGALVSIALSSLGLLDAIPRGDALSPNFTGCQILLFPAALSFWQGILQPSAVRWGLTGFLMLAALLPLEKPAISTTAILLFISMTLGLALPILRTPRAAPLALGKGVVFAAACLSAIAVLFAAALLFNDGQGLEYLEERFFKTAVADNSRDVSSGRFEMWRWGFEQWTESPLLGKGFGHEFIGETLSGELTRVSVHQEYINVLYKLGLVGFVPYCWILWIAARRILLSIRDASTEQAVVLLAGLSWLLSLMSTNLFGHTTAVQSMGLVFWPAMGLLIGWAEQAQACQNG